MNPRYQRIRGRTAPSGLPESAASISAKPVGRLAGSAGGGVKSSGKPREGFWSFVGFLILNIGLAYGFKVSPALGSLHALVVMAYGIILVIKRVEPWRIAQWAAYVVGAEVLWRMTKCPMPWEFGKLSILAVITFDFFRRGFPKLDVVPFVYLGLLLPSCLMTVQTLSLGDTRQQISFNLSGPACLAVCALWFPVMRGDMAQLVSVGKGMVGPIAGVGFLAFFSLATTDAAFGSNSNFVGSGGYGPNQVSCMLALGALFYSLMYFLENKSWMLRLLFKVMGLWLVVQSAMTFSRTGLYLIVGSLGAASVLLVRSKEMGPKLLLILLGIGLGSAVVFPVINSYTDGKLAERFADKNLTGRDTIADMDMQVFRENMVLGVGPGVSPLARARLGDNHAAHTEYTRLLSEHGILGFFALCLLFVMPVIGFWRARGPLEQAIVAALSVWSFGFMAGTGMRLAAPSFLIGLVQAGVLSGVGPRAVKRGGVSSRSPQRL